MWCLIKGFPWFMASDPKGRLWSLNVGGNGSQQSRISLGRERHFVEVQMVVW